MGRGKRSRRTGDGPGGGRGRDGGAGGSPGRSDVLHGAVHDIVERQLEMGEPPEAREALARLMASGMDRHEAVHRIGAVLAVEIHDTLKDGAHDPARYEAKLRELGVVDGDGVAGADGNEANCDGTGAAPGSDAPSGLDLVRPEDIVARGRQGTRLDWLTYELARGIFLHAGDDARRAVERHRLTDSELAGFATGMAKRMREGAMRKLAGGGQAFEVTDHMVMGLLPWIDPGAAGDLARAAGRAWEEQLDMCVECPNACITNADEPWDDWDD